MPGVNDSDGDEMDRESAESTNENEFTASSETEDEDSSELDEAECERRRAECISDMADLERQFALLKEQLYHERTAQVLAKLEEIKAGKAVEYLQPLHELEETRNTRLEVAAILKQLKIKSAVTKREAELLACHQNYENEKSLLKDNMQSDLEEKIRRLEEDRNNVDISSDLWNEQVTSKKNRKKNDPMFPDKRKKPVTVSGPYIVYMLREEEILEDWAIIKRHGAMSSHSQTPGLLHLTGC